MCVAAAGCRSSGDPQARIYDFSDGAAHSQPRILPIPAEQRAENKDVTAADWHPSGRKLAAASYKGLIRVWRKDGEPVFELDSESFAPGCEIHSAGSSPAGVCCGKVLCGYAVLYVARWPDTCMLCCAVVCAVLLLVYRHPGACGE